MKCPRDYSENMAFRLRLRQAAGDSVALQQQLLKQCDEDVLFFFNAFCWLYEPRPRLGTDGKPLPPVIPFITWPHQEPAILTIDQHLGYRDVGIEKSRGEGASWLSILLALRDWLFRPMSAIGLVSRNELAADNPDDPDSLMWKLDWELEKLPKWMIPHYSRNNSRHLLKNLDNDSTIVGASCTADVASGGRKRWFLMDELSKFPRGPDNAAMDSTQHVTDCRLIVSTPKGPDGAYYDAMHDQNSNMVKVVLDWKENPTRNRGLYRLVEGIPTAIDEDKYGPLSDTYTDDAKWSNLRRRLEARGFDPARGDRSEWYDGQCLRAGATPQSIAQELDRDYGGSVSRFFNVSVIERLIRTTTRPCRTRGNLIFDTEEHSPRWVEHPDGHLSLWFTPNVHGGPELDDYILGSDVSAGTGGAHSSNSTISVCRKVDGVKVAEFASPAISPENLADYAVAMCNWFRSPDGPGFLIWEVNGYGMLFRNRVVDTGFRNFYMRSVQEGRETLTNRKTRKPGFWSGKKSKRELLGEYGYALGMGLFTNPCKVALEECLSYMNLPGDKIEHVGASGADDPAGAGDNHGDRVIADALCQWARREQGGMIPEEKKAKEVERRSKLGNTFESRQTANRKKAKSNANW